MFYNFTDEARKIIVNAKKEMLNLKHPYVGTEHLLLALLKQKNALSNKLYKVGLSYSLVKKKLIDLVGIGKEESKLSLYTPVLKNVIENANDISKEYKTDITPEFLFLGILEEGEGIALRLMMNRGVDLDKLYQDFINKINKCKKNKKLYIEEVGINFNKRARNGDFDPVVGRDKEINSLIEILVRRTKNNPLLIGEAGVGKTALVEELSRRIDNNDVPTKLLDKKIINVDMSSLVAGTKYRGEFEEKVNKIIKELEEQDDIILFIDEIHTLVGAGGAEGAIDAANILKPALSRNKLQCIGATTINEYKKYIEKDKALDRRFQSLIIDEPKEEDVKNIVFKLKPIYEKYHNVEISNDQLNLIIKLSNKYLKNRKNPDKTIDILDEVCTHAGIKENKEMILYRNLTKDLKHVLEQKKQYIIVNNYQKALEIKEEEQRLMDVINDLELKLTKKISNKVTKKDILEVLKKKINIPIYELENNRVNARKLFKQITNEIVGQEDAIKNIIDSYINNIKDNQCISFLLSGPSGVGKTKFSTVFSSIISNNVIRLDMSEYSEEHSISKLIGSPAGYVGYDDNQYIFNQIRTYPFTTIILDEIERAHPKVINLFLQILDNNQIKDSKGNDIYFNNTVIIMTTNIEVKDTVGFVKRQNNEELNNYFGIPFINRITNIVKFKKLEFNDIQKIITKRIKQKYQKSNLNKHKFLEIIDKIQYDEYGARQIEQVLKKEINQLSK